ncbi:MAG: dihydropteroate synthase [Treponema sp.]|jgi:dihydropteroate synthase|nr:dihydropteroate synthase [Treponema sp.]
MKNQVHGFTFPPQKAPLPLPGGALLDFSRPLVMSIVNVTPDSFYRQSRNSRPGGALKAALQAEEDGADIVDFGAESTRPGSDYVSPEMELSRLIPVLKDFRRLSKLPVSVDTRKALVAGAALDEGADIINDISALADPDMAALAAGRGAALVLMHMRGSPKTMRIIAEEKEKAGTEALAIVGEVRDFLSAAAEKAAAVGIRKEKIIVDPGIGFGKTLGENLILLNRLAETCPPDYPVLVGLSRKSFIGALTGREAEERLAGTLAAQAAALFGGADILRVHDTRPARDLVRVIHSLRLSTKTPAEFWKSLGTKKHDVVPGNS